MLMKECELIPTWLKESFPKKCPYCGSLYHVGVSPNGLRVTKHYCPNTKCPMTIANKMAYCFEILGVTGIKAGKSLKVVKDFNIDNHFDGVTKVLTSKPKVDLPTFMRMCCIPGIDSGWNLICEKKTSINEVFEDVRVKDKFSDTFKQFILDKSSYFDIVYPEKQEYEPVLSLTVMMTGDIMGYSNREDFVTMLNYIFKGRLDLRYSKNKRKTGIDFLIKEESSPVTGKVNVAIENGIPIITPKDFMYYVGEQIKRRVEDGNHA